MNQRLRTRKDLLAAAARLLKNGKTPGMDDVAAEAMVSRATAYRYFPRIEALLVEAPLDGAAPDPASLFAGDRSTDPAERIDKAEAALHDMVYRNTAQLRLMLAAAIARAAQREPPAGGQPQNRKGKPGGGKTAEAIPIRQNRRTPLIEAALAPARREFSAGAYEKLCAALALIFGAESMIVFEDVLGVDEKAARRIKSWAARALVRTALEESRTRQ
jgi:AcrR family transcriptional regulator